MTAGAGLVGFIGVFADWFSVSYQTSGAQVVLDFYGTADGTGAIAVAASLGALMFGCAYILLQDPQIRKITALLMVLEHRVADLRHDRVHARGRGDRWAQPLPPGRGG